VDLQWYPQEKRSTTRWDSDGKSTPLNHALFSMLMSGLLDEFSDEMVPGTMQAVSGAAQ
jgi:hypothetical protein